MRVKLPLLALAGLCLMPGVSSAAASPPLPVTQHTGAWQSGHVQGIAIDRKRGYVYYSFTNMLAKFDFAGNLIGTVNGWAGHLGDLDFNPADGQVYGSLEYGKSDAFYIAVLDVNRIDRAGLDAVKTGILRAAYLPEVKRDYVAVRPDHRYGCSGIDGLAFGPAFGHAGGKHLLTVAYGIYGDPGRTDNDHQVLLQYDTADVVRHVRPLSESGLHRDGPAHVRGKYFVRTGNTTYGVQNLAYDNTSKRWFMGVYRGKKVSFPNYGLFAIDARSRPRHADLVGVPGGDGRRWEQGALIALADDGLRDESSGIRGWNQQADVGIQPVGNGLFYLVENFDRNGLQSAGITLMRWTGDAAGPFSPAGQ